MLKRIVIVSLLCAVTTVNYKADNHSVYDNQAKAILDIYDHDQFGEPITSSTFEIYDHSYNYVTTVTTDSTGHAKSKKLNTDYYYIQQMKVKSEYRLNDSFAKILVDANHSSIVQYDIMNKKLVPKQTYSIGVSVTDQNGVALTDLSVSIRSGDKSVSSTTNGSGKTVFDNLEKQTYNVCVLDQCQKLIIDGSQSEYALPFVINKTYGHVTVTVKSSLTGDLSGFEYDIYDDSDRYVESIETDENGVATSSDLPNGQYSVIETKTGDGSPVSDEVYTFVIDNNHTEVKYYPKYEANVGSVSMYCMTEDESPLANVDVQIYDDQNKLVDNTVTDENGYLLFSDLNPGSYNLKINAMPAPYVTDRINYKVTVSDDATAVANNGDPIIFYDPSKEVSASNKNDNQNNQTSNQQQTKQEVESDDASESIVQPTDDTSEKETTIDQVDSQSAGSEVTDDLIDIQVDKSNTMLDELIMALSLLGFVCFKFLI